MTSFLKTFSEVLLKPRQFLIRQNSRPLRRIRFPFYELVCSLPTQGTAERETIERLKGNNILIPRNNVNQFRQMIQQSPLTGTMTHLLRERYIHDPTVLIPPPFFAQVGNWCVFERRGLY